MAKSFFGINKNRRRNNGVIDNQLKKPKNTYQEPGQSHNQSDNHKPKRKTSTMRAYRDSINKIKAIQVAEKQPNVSATFNKVLNDEISHMSSKEKFLYRNAMTIFNQK